ncbi:unnamed protein product, partial [Mycena citricolor]
MRPLVFSASPVLVIASARGSVVKKMQASEVVRKNLSDWFFHWPRQSAHTPKTFQKRCFTLGFGLHNEHRC